jgi:Abortive infection alpha
MDENLTKAVSDLTGIVTKLAGPLADEFGQILGDKVSEYRIRNWIKVAGRIQKMLTEAGIDPRSIAPKLFLPALQASSLEENETLQEKWAALLANASDPNKSASIESSFVEVLKQLNAEQALFLDRIFVRVTMGGKLKPHITTAGMKLGNFNIALQLFAGDMNPQSVFTDERLRERAVLVFDDLVRLGLMNRVLFDEETLRRVGSQAVNIRSQNDLQRLFNTETVFYVTPFGVAFIQACTAPEASAAASSNRPGP